MVTRPYFENYGTREMLDKIYGTTTCRLVWHMTREHVIGDPQKHAMIRSLAEERPCFKEPIPELGSGMLVHDWERATFLDYVCRHGCIDCAKILLDTGSDPCIHTTNPKYLIVCAMEHPDILRLILDYGADAKDPKEPVDSLDTDDGCSIQTGQSTLLEHSMYKSESLRILIDYGARAIDFNWADEESMLEFIQQIDLILLARDYCRKAALFVGAMYKNPRCPIKCVTGQDKNVMRLIMKHIWSTRIGERDYWEGMREITHRWIDNYPPDDDDSCRAI